MAENRKWFTFIWKIKNISFFHERNMYSPPVCVHAMGGTKWKLEFYPNSDRFKDCVVCYLQKLHSGSDSDILELDLELSFLSADESVLQSETLRKKVSQGSEEDGTTHICVKRDDVYFHKKDLFIPDDTLTIRLRICHSLESIPQSMSCFAETKIGTEYESFVSTIEKFSCLELRKIYALCNKSLSAKMSHFSVNITVSSEGLLDFEVKSLNSIIYYKYEIFILDKFKNKLKSGRGEFFNSKLHYVPLAVTKDFLIKNKEYFLQNDKLTILCEVLFPGSELKNEMKYTLNYQATQETIANTDVSSQEYHIENLNILKDDLISLFNDRILCDTKLKTATETFPAHTTILSARSSVFKSMFTTDMKEKTNNYVEIEDLDADTVRRMLLFMYSANLDELEYESAKSLYFAADKYNIDPLRQWCRSFLKQNLSPSSCCDILLLADKHQDQDLKDAVQDYIAENDKAVLFSDEWKDLERNHSQLIVEVFRFIYMKNRSN